MKVKNLNGTTQNICKCGSWLEHWKRFSGYTPTCCAEARCAQKPEVGAHVQKDSETDSRWYIIPLCKMHNGETGKSLSIGDRVPLVSANVKETCGQ